MRFFYSICGILLLISCLAAAQEPAAQDVQDLSRFPYRQSRRPRPQPPANPTPANPATIGQNAPVQPPAQPQAAPTVPIPATALRAVPEPAQPENLPPPTPAQVTYRDGMLTVQAMNSTLAGLLTAIRNKTGIQFEGLEAGAPERVVVSIGPAPESDVLATILGGSKFDYVVLERPDSPGTVQRVLLTPRGGSSAVAGQPPLNVRSHSDDDDDEQASTDAEPQDTPVRPPLSQVQSPQPQQNQTSPTPEQLMERLKQLQQLQQQQQQQQQQQNPAPPAQPPPT